MSFWLQNTGHFKLFNGLIKCAARVALFRTNWYTNLFFICEIKLELGLRMETGELSFHILHFSPTFHNSKTFNRGGTLPRCPKYNRFATIPVRSCHSNYFSPFFFSLPLCSALFFALKEVIYTY